ncbi:MAG: serine/threonine protein kinase, partial [Planctomyces sp.]|nr:serine/threonine protein kinase [Planctomyces sp.]
MRLLRLMPSRVLLVASLALGAMPPVSADEKPAPFAGAKPASDWPSYRQNLQQTGVATSTLPAQLELLWEVNLGDQVEATCAISGGKVYAPSLSGHITSLDLKTGKKEWAYQSIEEIPSNSFAPGFKAPVTVHAGVVYAGDEDGLMHAIDAATGKKKWIYKTEGEIYSGAVVMNDRLLFGSYDNALHCVKLDDGSRLWKFETDGYVHCTPGIAENTAFIAGCDEHLRRIDVETGKQIADLPLATYLIASPAIRGDLLYVGTYASEVVAVNWRELKVAWRYKPSDKEFPFHSSAALGERVLVIGGRDKAVHG